MRTVKIKVMLAVQNHKIQSTTTKETESEYAVDKFIRAYPNPQKEEQETLALFLGEGPVLVMENYNSFMQKIHAEIQ
jgi:hypothetical protein